MAITTAVIHDRAAIRALAAANAASTAVRKMARAWFSRPKAWTVSSASMVSEAAADASATRSCATVDSRRTCRPKPKIGIKMAGTISSSARVSLGLTVNSITIAPTTMIELRRAIEADEPTSVSTSVASVVSRDSASPVRVRAK